MLRTKKPKFQQNYGETRDFDDSSGRRKFISYWILAALRIILTIWPQTGYIHPDEFFQSIEVIAGDHFDIDVSKPWEFNVTFPLRTASIPQLTVGIPYTLISLLSPHFSYLFGFGLKNPYFFLILPRLLICFFSFVSDFCLYKICRIFGRDFRARLLMYGSSYVMLTYATRTFSNTVELVLFSVLIYYVARCMAFSEKVILQSDHLTVRHQNSRTPTERVKYYKLLSSLPPHSLKNCFTISTLTILGIFNRPTFLIFAFPPLFFWLHRGLGSKNVDFLDFNLRFFCLIFSAIPSILFFIIFDSFYFGYLTLEEIFNFQLGFENFVVTPVNFLRYNLETTNLANHGIHRRWTHLVVNLPLLFGVVGVVAVWRFGKMVYSGFKGRWLELPRVQSIEGLMTASFIVPIFLLSLFPHQEPRFIIPILLPIIFLHSETIAFAPNNSTVLYRKIPHKMTKISQKNLEKNGEKNLEKNGEKNPQKNLEKNDQKIPQKNLEKNDQKIPQKNLEKNYQKIPQKNNQKNNQENFQQIPQKNNQKNNQENFQQIPQKNNQKNYQENFQQIPQKNNQKNNQNNPQKNYQKIPQKLTKSQIFWIFSNFLLTIFYGFYHQGGIFSLASHFSRELKSKPDLTHVHLFTSYSYSLPTSFLQLRNTRKIYTNNQKIKYRLKKDFFLHEEGNLNFDEVFKKIERELNDCELKYETKKIPYRIYYAFPKSFLQEFQIFFRKYRENWRQKNPEIWGKFFHDNSKNFDYLENENFDNSDYFGYGNSEIWANYDNEKLEYFKNKNSENFVNFENFENENLENSENENSEKLDNFGNENSKNLDNFGNENSENLENVETKNSENLENSGNENSENLDNLGNENSENLDNFGNENSDNLENFGNKNPENSKNVENENSENLDNSGNKNSEKLDNFENENSENLDNFETKNSENSENFKTKNSELWETYINDLKYFENENTKNLLDFGNEYPENFENFVTKNRAIWKTFRDENSEILENNNWADVVKKNPAKVDYSRQIEMQHAALFGKFHANIFVNENSQNSENLIKDFWEINEKIDPENSDDFDNLEYFEKRVMENFEKIDTENFEKIDTKNSENLEKTNSSILLDYDIVKYFHPHISTEKLPNLDFHFENFFEIKKIVNFLANISENWWKFSDNLGLVLVKIEAEMMGDKIVKS